MKGAFVRLDGRRTSYVLDCRGPGMPACLHWGGALDPATDPAALAAARVAPRRESALDLPNPYTLMPEAGLGFLGLPAIKGARGQTDWATDFVLADVTQDADGVRLTLDDTVASLRLVLDVSLDRASDVIRRRVTLTNTGAASYTLHWLAAACFTLNSGCNEALVLEGSWAREFATDRVPLRTGTWSRENRRSRPGLEGFPGLIVGHTGFDEWRGGVYGFHLAWSGRFALQADVGPEGDRLVQLGPLLEPGEVVLDPKETFATPWVYASFAPDGLNALSQNFHRYFRGAIRRSAVAERPRPVHFNSWEAVYFDHDVATLKDLATAAAAVGAERFVLDDGWFKGRNGANAGLGDWSVDTAKYPDGLAPLIDHVRGLGLEFGIWVEPEMVNPDSDMFRAHPDWAMDLPGRRQPTGRNQLVLDLTNPAVRDTLFAAIDALLRDHDIGYVKWDYNRDEAPSADAAGRPAAFRQTEAFYRLLDDLRAAHPNVEFESCASGGGRVDFEVMKRCERFWTSDQNDAIARQQIQRGCSLFFPPEVMGAHIGPSRSHQTGRAIPLGFRAGTAMFGHMGIEWDIRTLDEDERAELRAHLDNYKRHRALIHSGDLYRIPFEDAGGQGWAVVAPDGAEALVSLARWVPAQYTAAELVRVPGLRADADYRVRVLPPIAAGSAEITAHLQDWAGDGKVIGGSVIMENGLRLAPTMPQCLNLVHIERV